LKLSDFDVICWRSIVVYLKKNVLKIYIFVKKLSFLSERREKQVIEKVSWDVLFGAASLIFIVLCKSEKQVIHELKLLISHSR
jgi:nitrate/nitrite-specific signal transduction histidine kinase